MLTVDILVKWIIVVDGCHVCKSSGCPLLSFM